MQRNQKRLQEELEDDSIPASGIDAKLVTGYQGIYNRVFKRALDLCLACFVLVCVSPVLIIAALAVLVEDGRPILYRAERGGYHNRTFRICKFRSMIKHADQVGGGTTALHDNRITKVGNLLRKTKVDEFANLFNIITGEMSFIGPRPELLRYTRAYRGTEKLILEVRPGITDYSSIAFINLDEIVGSGNADERYEKYVLPKKNKLRVQYAADVSFRTDVKLFFLTIGKVLKKSYSFLVKQEHR